MKEKAAYLRGLIEGLGIDETTKEGKVIKAMSELLGELAEAVDGIDEDVTRAYDQINDLSEELEDLEADLYEDDEDDAYYSCDDDDDFDDDDFDDDDDETLYETVCPSCNNVIALSESVLEEGEMPCPCCGEMLEFDYSDLDDDAFEVPIDVPAEDDSAE